MDKKLNTLIQSLLALSTKAHYWHLTTESYAEHMAFGDLYTYAHDAVDSIAEAARSAYNLKLCECKLTVDLNDTSRAVADLVSLIRMLDTCRDQDWLNARIDDIQSSLHQYVYKLKFLS